MPPAARAGVVTLGGKRTVNRLGFGAMRLTGEGVWGEPYDPEQCRKVLRRAVELGVNFVDTADSYGPEVSERLIAQALRPYPDDLVIASKGGLVRPGPSQWKANGRPEHLRAACEDSLLRLRLETIDLYQLHRPDPDVPFEESLGTLINLRNEGKIRLIGVSNVSSEQLRTAIGMTSISSVQNRYNLCDRSSEDVLEMCEQEAIAFIPWYPLATGELTRRGGVVDQLARRHKATPAQVALAWLLARSRLMLPIPGTASLDHLEENVAAARVELQPDEVERLESAA